MKLIVGLGNPGNKYAHHRHNVGFMALDNFAKKVHWPAFKQAKDWQAETAENGSGDTKAVLLKPQTYMNESGQAVAKVAQFYKLTPADVMVIYDELDLPFGTVRVREGGSSAGHNGVELIINHLGDGFVRVRIGIANQFREQHDASSFVLSDFSQDEQGKLPTIFDYVDSVIAQFVANGVASAHTEVVA